MRYANFDEILLKVKKPARYVGGEFNLPSLNKPHKVSFCLCFPDVYEVAMSNLGLQILYNILNQKSDVVAERCFAPWVDLGDELVKNDIPLLSIETKKPLNEFDFLGFSLQYELCYTTVLYMLDLARVPFFATERGENHPILIAGGPCSVNPMPYKDFFDIICIGDGEEFVEQIAEIGIKFKGNKAKILAEAAKLNGAYVPLLHDKLTVDGGQFSVKKAVVCDLNKTKYPLKPLVSNLEIVHDRPVVELFRGCYSGCRFCQACFFYRPVRLRSEESVVDISKCLIANTGAEEISFSSLSSGDYPYIKTAIEKVFSLAQSKNVKLQLPSLRLDSFNDELTKNMRKTSLTFAPEAGTQRLRDVINKNISDEDITGTFRSAFLQGVKSVKLYFMVGLPTETDDDLAGIVNTVKKIKYIYYETIGRKDVSIGVSSSVFVPKPLTPFQWAGQLSIDETKRRQRFLREEFKKMRGVNYSWHEETTSMLEAIFARGDSNLSKLIVFAYKNGCFFDSWNEIFSFSKWQTAIEQSEIDIDKYLCQKDTADPLPWDFIDFVIKKQYLLNEYEKAMRGETTRSCKGECLGCGAGC
jgi:radical SAM family uncharacterized protein